LEGEFWERRGFEGFLTRFWWVPLVNQAGILVLYTLFRLFKWGCQLVRKTCFLLPRGLDRGIFPASWKVQFGC